MMPRASHHPTVGTAEKVQLLDAYSGHGGVATAFRGEGQSDPECRNGDNAAAKSSPPGRSGRSGSRGSERAASALLRLCSARLRSARLRSARVRSRRRCIRTGEHAKSHSAGARRSRIRAAPAPWRAFIHHFAGAAWAPARKWVPYPIATAVATGQCGTRSSGWNSDAFVP